jgi:hypothetical protein
MQVGGVGDEWRTGGSKGVGCGEGDRAAADAPGCGGSSAPAVSVM